MNYKVSDPRFWEERRKKNDGRANTQRMLEKYGGGNRVLNQDSNQDEARENSSMIYNFLSEALFDRISFISFPFSKTQQIYPITVADSTAAAPTISDVKPWTLTDMEDDGIALIDRGHIQYHEEDVSDLVNYWAVSRIPNTSEGKFLAPDRDSRMRCSFYVSNGKYIDGYLLTNVVYDSFSSLNYFTSMGIFRSYVGLRFLEGKAYVVVKEVGKDESLTPIDINIDSVSSSTTWKLEIKTTGKQSDILIDDILIGSFSSDSTSGYEGQVSSYLPLMMPARMTEQVADPSGGYYTVGITIENFLFIQDNY